VVFLETRYRLIQGNEYRYTSQYKVWFTIAKKEKTPTEQVATVLVVILLCVGGYIWLAQKQSVKTLDATQLLPPGEAYSTKSFDLWVPEYQHIEFSEHIGDEYFGKTVEDPGTLFCVIPICVKNKTNATESLIGVTWYLHTDSGLRFEIHSMADLFRDESEKLNPHDIPPAITRCGGLVFLVTSNAQGSKTLILEADGFSFNARFEVLDSL